MKCFSTKNKLEKVSFEQAVFEGMPTDGGLYMLYPIPRLDKEKLTAITSKKSFRELATALTEILLGDDLSNDELEELAEAAFSFSPQLIQISQDVFSLELFHGPTLAFKDFGAYFMAALISVYLKRRSQKITILVATSGDTGSAIGRAFHHIDGVEVYLLFPSGRVSHIQEKMLTTIGDNVTAIEVEGDFDDCQKLVKMAFTDPTLKLKSVLTSANSINLARLLPQTFYYFWVYSQLQRFVSKKPLVISVPSGNLGNLTAAVLAWRMGLPVVQFISAMNRNRVFYDYLTTGEFKPRPAIPTISNAMDVGRPNNFERLQELFSRDWQNVTNMVTPYWFDDQQTKLAIAELNKKKGYLMDPHGAVAWLALSQYLKTKHADYTGVFCETAHPAKFASVMDQQIFTTLEIPEVIQRILTLSGHSLPISADYADFRDLLIECDTQKA